MSTIKMSDEIDHNRRRFSGSAAMTIAAAQFGMITRPGIWLSPSGGLATAPAALT